MARVLTFDEYAQTMERIMLLMERRERDAAELDELTAAIEEYEERVWPIGKTRNPSPAKGPRR